METMSTENAAPVAENVGYRRGPNGEPRSGCWEIGKLAYLSRTGQAVTV